MKRNSWTFSDRALEIMNEMIPEKIDIDRHGEIKKVACSPSIFLEQMFWSHPKTKRYLEKQGIDITPAEALGERDFRGVYSRSGEKKEGWPDADWVPEILRLRKEGTSLLNIAEKVGVSLGTVQYHLSKHGIA